MRALHEPAVDRGPARRARRQGGARAERVYRTRQLRVVDVAKVDAAARRDRRAAELAQEVRRVGEVLRVDDDAHLRARAAAPDQLWVLREVDDLRPRVEPDLAQGVGVNGAEAF